MGRVHVALRSGGALVTIDPTKGTIVARRNVCPAPRGLAWDSATDLVWVACATGELAALPAGGGPATVQRVVERDLRDVIIDNGSIAVTKFRSAEVLRLASDGTIARRDGLPNDGSFAPHVLWRAVRGPSQKVVTVHQEHSTLPLPTHVVGGYGSGPESGAVAHRCTVMNADGSVEISVRLDGVLPVDVAVSPDGSSAAVVAAGDGFVPGLASLFLVSLSASASPISGPPPTNGPLGAFGPDAGSAVFTGGSLPTIVPSALPFGISAKQLRTPGTALPVGQTPIAVAFDSSGRVLVQTREPARLWVIGASKAAWIAGTTGTEITLASVSRDDTGHDVFHASAGATIACASCHPEGGDDGHTWLLDSERRRTPSLRGTLAGTAPYHWQGDEADLVVLTDDVYSQRMNGANLDASQMNALTGWLQAVPAPPAPTWIDPTAAQRGRALFERADTQCASCHSGPKLTNNQTVDVGTGKPFQVPPLVGVGWRVPLLHDGCAKSIADRFLACSTSRHGTISGLSQQDVSDLTAYLETL
jgi:cytochrome c553